MPLIAVLKTIASFGEKYRVGSYYINVKDSQKLVTASRAMTLITEKCTGNTLRLWWLSELRDTHSPVCWIQPIKTPESRKQYSEKTSLLAI